MSMIRSKFLEQLGIFVEIQILCTSGLLTGSATTCLEIENLFKSNPNRIFLIYIAGVHLVTIVWSDVHCLHLTHTRLNVWIVEDLGRVELKLPAAPS